MGATISYGGQAPTGAGATNYIVARRVETGPSRLLAHVLPPPLRLVYSPATFKRQLKKRHFYTITLLIHIVRRPCVSALTSP